MPASTSPFESLAAELIEHTCEFLENPEDVTSIARTSKTMRNTLRSLRWRTIVIKESTYFQLREWLLWGVKIELIRCVTMGIQEWPPGTSAIEFALPVDGLDITLAIEKCVQNDFSRYLRTLVLPERWTPETEGAVKVMGAIGPNRLRTLVLGKGAGSAWYTDLQAMWTASTMDALLASVTRISFWNAPQNGLHFVLSRVPPSVGQPMHTLVKRLEIRKDTTTKLWSDPESPGDPDEQMLSVSAEALDIDLCTGILSRIEHLCFPLLVMLAVRIGRTFPFAGEWHLVQRLLIDCAPSLKELHLYKGDSEDDTDIDTLLDDPNADTFERFSSCSLSELSRVVVQWSVVDRLQGISHLVGMAQVELVVDGYDMNVAEDREYVRVLPVLQLTHWKKVVFMQNATATGPGSDRLRTVRQTYLRERLGMEDIEFV